MGASLWLGYGVARHRPPSDGVFACEVTVSDLVRQNVGHNRAKQGKHCRCSHTGVEQHFLNHILTLHSRQARTAQACGPGARRRAFTRDSLCCA
jgi:hypothetical protein